MFEVEEWSIESTEENDLVHKLFGDISRKTSDESKRFTKKTKSKRRSEAKETKCKTGPVKVNVDNAQHSNLKETLSLSSKKRKRAKTKSKMEDEIDDLPDHMEPGLLPTKRKRTLTSSSLFQEVVDTVGIVQTIENQNKKKQKKKQKQTTKAALGVDRMPQIETDLCTNINGNFEKKNKKKNIKKQKQESEAALCLEMMPHSETNLCTNNNTNDNDIEKKSKKKSKKKKKQKQESEVTLCVEMIPQPETYLCTDINDDIEKKNKKEKECQQNQRMTSFNETDLLDEAINIELPQKNITSSNGTKSIAASPASNFQRKIIGKLEASQFRWINEQLYTTTGQEAMELFSNDPMLFDVYHRGFSSQVKQWPANPVNIIIKWLKERPPSLVVADFGCGEAEISQSIPNPVYSFDLVAKNKFVTACDMSKVPLPDASVDVAVFCLSLMGTNLTDYLKEAKRVLKQGAILKIAEVVSRIEDIDTFVKSLCQLGFQLQAKDTSSKMFVLFEFSKSATIARKDFKTGTPRLKLKPCIYKRR